MPRIAYNCKFCGKPGYADYSDDCPPLKIDIWKGWLACNPCADFHSKRLRIEHVIAKECNSLAVMNTMRDETFKAEDEKDQQTREKSRLNLVELTKAYAYHVCHFYNRPVTWEPEFATILCDTPNKANLVLHQYLKDMINPHGRV